jgi:hypothetical protein
MLETADPTLPSWFVPKAERDKPEGEQTRFKIRGLLGTEAMDVNFVQDDLGGGLSMTARGGNACLKHGLLAWENHKDAKTGQPAEYDDKNWRRNVERMRPELNIELALAIWDKTFLSGEQEKN